MWCSTAIHATSATMTSQDRRVPLEREEESHSLMIYLHTHYVCDLTEQNRPDGCVLTRLYFLAHVMTASSKSNEMGGCNF